MASAISNYSGIQLDQLYEKGLQIADRDNGWTKLSSTSEAPVNLNNLMSPGFFGVEYWSNGPSDLSQYQTAGKGMLMVANTKMGDDITQHVWFFGQTEDSYHRVYSESAWGQFVLSAENTDVSRGTTAPSNPEDKQVWLDQSGSDPMFKAYDEYTHTWKEMLPGDSSLASVYDSTGQSTDAFLYVDNLLETVTEDSSHHTYESHMEDDVIHVSATETSYWNQKATTSSFGTAIDNAKDDLRTEVTTQTSSFDTSTDELNDKLDDFATDISTHTADMTIHFANGYATQKAVLDAKADGNHTHINDGKVQIDAAYVIGVLDAARIPDIAKDITKTVANDTIREAMTSADVDTGDWVYVTSTKLLWYVVSATDQGCTWRKFSTGGTAYQWSNMISNTIPTTISGLGITDLYTQSEIDDMISDLNDNNSLATTYMNAITAKSGLLTAANIAKIQQLQSEIDQAKETLDFINNYSIS